jgi:HPt (histidine-containing phosphotransfer) domain-containing protein
MIKTAAQAAELVCAPPLAPDQQAIDLVHLARLTFGDESLQVEVLRLFDRQSEMLSERMARSAPNVIGALAHTLKGSARGIGAWNVAAAAEALENAAAIPCANDIGDLRDRLNAAIAEAHEAIGRLLNRH